MKEIAKAKINIDEKLFFKSKKEQANVAIP